MLPRGTVTGRPATHWERVYREQGARLASWFEPRPEHSLQLVRATGVAPDAAIIDIGGGASRLAAELLDAGYRDVAVADISPAALTEAKAEMGEQAEAVEWIVADVREHRFERRYDLWHDRALFHFMVEPADRQGYIEVLRATLRRGGHLVLATFGLGGPEQCSGLPVVRYGADGLLAALGDRFELRSSSLVEHKTPAGNSQQFLYAHLQRVR